MSNPEAVLPGAGSWSLKDGLLTESRLSALRLKHGFTTKSLGDMKDAARVKHVAGMLDTSMPLTLKQVHGTAILDAHPENAGFEADGWLLSSPGVTVGVYVADCVPLYLWADNGKAAGVFHAGWKGTAAGMAKLAAKLFFDRFAIKPESLSAALGPHIGPCCYKVGTDFERIFHSNSLVGRGSDLYLDLALETKRQLIEAGLKAQNIGASAGCTCHNESDYYSFRRQKQVSRMLALLSLDQWPS